MGRPITLSVLVACAALPLTGCIVHRNPTLDFRLAVRGASVVDAGEERALTMAGDTVRDIDLEVVVWGAPTGFILSFQASSDGPAEILWDEAQLISPGGSPHPLEVSDEARIRTSAPSGVHGMRLLGRIYRQRISTDGPTVALFRSSDESALGPLWRLENQSCRDLLTRSVSLMIPMEWGDGRREYRIALQPGWFFFHVPGAETPSLRCGAVPADIG